MIMRHCCCCKVTTGSVILGVWTLVVSLVIMVPLIGYITNTDIEGLNIIQHNQKTMEKVVEDLLEKHSWTEGGVQEIMTQLREWFPRLVWIFTAYGGVTAIFSFLLVVGVCCEVRSLLVPFLILTMLDIILSGTLGIVVVVALFYVNTVHGAVSLAVYLVTAIVALYCWATVLSAFKLLASGSRERYDYSPVTPSKDVPQYYPSAPQYFAMEDYNDSATRR